MENRIDRFREELRKLGIVTKETNDKDWFMFVYSDLTFRFILDEKQDYLALGLAFYQEEVEVERSKILSVINKINDQMLFVKVIEMGNVLWLTYELDVEKRLPEREEIRKMIMLLTGGFFRLARVYDEVVGLEGKGAEDDENREEFIGSFDWDEFVNGENNKEDDGR